MKLEVIKTANLGENETITFKIDGEVVSSKWVVSRVMTDTTGETYIGLFENRATFIRADSDTSVTVDFGSDADLSQPAQTIAAELASRSLRVKAAFFEKYPAKYDYGMVEL